MRIRNKKTGEIVERVDITIREEGVVFNNDETYNSLAELNAEWEDCEEPKEYWYVSDNGYICSHMDDGDSWDEHRKEIGNYFETKEEAEKAVEKLRAWKRLKDKGFRFSKWFTRVEGGIQINMEYNKYDGIDSECREDLDICFEGGE